MLLSRKKVKWDFLCYCHQWAVCSSKNALMWLSFGINGSHDVAKLFVWVAAASFVWLPKYIDNAR